MSNYEASITIQKDEYVISVESFGEGPIPILICGHAEIYANLLKKAFEENGLLTKYCFFTPRLYWCQDGLNIASEQILKLTLQDLALHLEEIRLSLENQGLLVQTKGKIGLYCHSFFSALAFEYVKTYATNTLFIEAECPPPYNTSEWGREKATFFNNNAETGRLQALKRTGITPDSSAVDEKCLNDFESYSFAYNQMNATLWYDYLNDHRQQIWGHKKLNMTAIKSFFILLRDYDCRNVIDKIDCPIHLTLGLYDTAVPYYLWIDPENESGIGFFSKKERSYHIHTQSGHWPFTEQSAESCQEFDLFINNIVAHYPGNEFLLELLQNLMFPSRYNGKINCIN